MVPRSVANSAKQVFGAERWLRNHGDRIYLDHGCANRFPLPLPKDRELKIHRVVIALGAARRCRAHFGGSGSLMLSPLGGEHDIGDTVPFTIGDISRGQGYVHVFDDVTLDVVLRELDTVSDLTDYLVAKERFIRSGALLGAAGEEDLLALFLARIDGAGKHYFRLPADAAAMSIDEGHWSDFRASRAYAAKALANKVSYLWDELIERFCKNIAAGTLAIGAELGLTELEKGVRIMAGESRLARRGLAAQFVDAFRKTPPDGALTRVVLSPQRAEVGYVFILEPRGEGTHEAYISLRMSKLQAYCYVLRYLNPQLRQVVGVAIEPLGNADSSESLVHLDATEWRQEDEDLGREFHEKGLLQRVRRFAGVAHEYPTSSTTVVGSTPKWSRNRAKKRRQDARKRWALAHSLRDASSGICHARAYSPVPGRYVGGPPR